MSELPRPKKKRVSNTDANETVVINVNQSDYSEKNIDNLDTSKIPAREIREQSRQSQQNYQNNQYNSNQYNNNYNNSNNQYRSSSNYSQGMNGSQLPRSTSRRSSGSSSSQSSRPRTNSSNQSTRRTQPRNNHNNYNNNNNNPNYNNNYARARQPESEYIPSERDVYANRGQSQRRNNPQDDYYYEQPQQKPKRRKKRKSFRLLKTLVLIVAVIFIIYSALALLCILRMNHVSDSSRSRTASAMSSTSVTNILLIGTDSRDTSTDRGRSDSMMLISLNSSTHKMYLSSFMRDAYVDIPGYGSAKLNAAYSYGGAELLMDTIEYNYKIAIDSYISVSFVGFADIIDAVGGIKVTVSDSEADALNVILQSEVNEIMGDDVNSDLLSGGGTYTLNGKQALSYSRIRYVGNADFERTERQRNVMEQVVSKLKSMNPVYFTKILGNAVPELTTNMSTPDLYLFSLRIPTMIFYKSEQQQVPADGTWSDATINGESVLQVDFDANIKILEETVFG
jgi:LCP family protein required for cell wall assembly